MRAIGLDEPRKGFDYEGQLVQDVAQRLEKLCPPVASTNFDWIGKHREQEVSALAELTSQLEEKA